MSHSGFKVIDSDMHIIEPTDLWQRYIDPKFKDGAPTGVNAPMPRSIGANLSYGRPSQHPDALPHMNNWFAALRKHMTPIEHEYEFATRRGYDGSRTLRPWIERE